MSDWSTVRLGEVATCFLSGGTPPTKRAEYWQGEIPWITSKWLGNRLELKNGEKFISKEASEKTSTRIVPKDNIIFATRVGVGKVGINKIDLAINQDLAGILIDNKKFDLKFLAYQLSIDTIQQYVAMNKRGATIKGITRECLKDIRLNLPTLPEQKKIAHILSTVQRAIEEQERIIQTTTELKKALMQKLFTEGLRGEPQKETEIGLVPESWEVATLEHKAESFQYGTSVKCGYETKGKLVLRIPNVVGGHIDISDLKFGIPKKTEIGKLTLQAGDLLFVRTNGVKENAGRCSQFNDELDDCYYASYLIRVRLDSEVLNSSFLSEYSRTEVGTSFLSGRSIRTADGKFNINSGTLKTMLVPVPKIKEQGEIANNLALVDRKIAIAQVKKGSLNSLFRTLLHELMTAKIRVDEIELPEFKFN